MYFKPHRFVGFHDIRPSLRRHSQIFGRTVVGIRSNLSLKPSSAFTVLRSIFHQHSQNQPSLTFATTMTNKLVSALGKSFVCIRTKSDKRSSALDLPRPAPQHARGRNPETTKRLRRDLVLFFFTRGLHQPHEPPDGFCHRSGPTPDGTRLREVTSKVASPLTNWINLASWVAFSLDACASRHRDGHGLARALNGPPSLQADISYQRCGPHPPHLPL